jgi:hypothetical protein
MTEHERRRIVECTDPATFDGWADRALSVASVSELFGSSHSKDDRVPDRYRWYGREARQIFWAGFANGMAEEVLQVLVNRRLTMTDRDRRRISECTSLGVVIRWQRRAHTVMSVDELFDSPTLPDDA